MAQLKKEEVWELLQTMSIASENLAKTMASIQTNFGFLSQCPGLEAQEAVESFRELHRCLRRILTKERFSIEDL